MAIFDSWGVPFEMTVVVTILLIWVYTFRSGIKTIIWTDTLQTLFMLVAVGLSVYLISVDMNLNFTSLLSTIRGSDYSQIFFWDGKQHFIRQFLSGAFMAIVMTGLDQDMMQKNLSCKSLADAKKNMFWFSIVLVFVNLLFLSLGALLYMYAETHGISFNKADDLFPAVALNGGLGIGVGVLFILGLIAAAYSSADSALTSLTTSFCIDLLGFNIDSGLKEIKQRKLVHLGFSILLVLVILVFKSINDESVISSLFKVAGYTYGPLLGMYAFGLFTKLSVKDNWVPLVAILSPVACYLIQIYIPFGFELLILNGLITFVGLYFLRISK
jgi:Na+/proline symporter